jgi:hypothetical protein
LSFRDFVVVPLLSILSGTSFAVNGRSRFRAGNGYTEHKASGMREGSFLTPRRLVVEDFDESRFMRKVPIELSGYRVVKTISGKEAVEVARQDPPHLS